MINILTINYDNIGYLLDDWPCNMYVNIQDVDYLIEFLEKLDIKIDIKVADLCRLYNRFSEEMWSASWEDNAEGQFIEWLKEKI